MLEAVTAVNTDSGSALESGTVRFVATRKRLRSMNSPSSGKRSERWHPNAAEAIQPTGSVEPKLDERKRSAGVVHRAQQAHLAVQDTQLCERPDLGQRRGTRMNSELPLLALEAAP